MPTVADLVVDKSDQIDFERIRTAYPWLFAREQDCIISPDSDGLLCGLLMSHYLDWRIRGFYYGKVLVHHHEVEVHDSVFLDMEIFRSDVRSAGQHMLLYNRNRCPELWDQFASCFSINNFRDYDGLHDFRLKYPFATVHFLMVVLNSQIPVPVSGEAVIPLLFTDGTYHNLFRYTENSLDWLRYLRANEDDNPLSSLFARDSYTVVELMRGMNEFWRARDSISVSRERGDRVAISLRGSAATPMNLDETNGLFSLSTDAKERAERFICLLENATEWAYQRANWDWRDWKLSVFEKSSTSAEGQRLNASTFDRMIAQRPLSFAMTSGNNYEFTLDPEGRFEDS